MEPAHLHGKLEAFLRARMDRRAQLAELRAADGHAGLTYLVAVETVPGRAPSRFVLRLAPPGVRRKGNTDVYRQVPLLRALRALGLPVPAVPHAEPGEEWLGTPFLLMERLPGRPFFVWDPDPAFADDPAEIAGLWRAAVELLPRFHDVPWQSALAGWEAPRSLDEEVRAWRTIYPRAPEPRWVEAAERVEARLLRRLPSGEPVGLVHGDYQPGNILYEDGRISGVIDWELSGIGAQLVDVGWLMMLCDRESWHEAYRPRRPIPPKEVVALYEARRGMRVAEPHWYQAFAQFKLGAIACLNVRLHRKGRRPDPVWERMALSVPLLFSRAEALLDEEAR